MQDINLYQLISFYAKKWYWILLLTVVGAAAGFIYNSYIQVPLYKSDATLLLVSSEDKKVTPGPTLINNYIALFKSRRVLEPVIAKQNNSISYEELVASTTATNDKNTEVIKISIGTKDPVLSKELVDGVVVSFKQEVKELYNLENITIVDNASETTRPYNVNKTMQIALPTAVGLFTSLAILFFVYDMSLTRKKKPVTKKVSVKATATKPKTSTQSEGKSKKTAALKSSTKALKAAEISAETKPAPKKRTPKTTKTTARATSTKRKK